ncbi:hypothetical protein IT568_03190 [bacterium]|nr:hypothetical protein [bacterium]
MKKLIFLFLVLAGSVFAQEPFPIEVDDAKAEDLVGRRLAYLIKEEIRKSQSMRLTVLDEPRITLILTTLPKEKEDPSVATIYSAVKNLSSSGSPPTYLGCQLGYCGSSVVEEAAQLIVAGLDELLTDLAKIGNSRE